MLLLKHALQWYKTIIVEPLDPRPTQWPFTGNLMCPLGIIALYVWIVKHKGPELMANRKAFDLKWVLVAFNASQVIINAYLFYLALSLGWLNGYSLRCQPVDYSTSELAMEIAWGVYLYYVVKLVDLLDTVFYVMRKRDRQISFLHVYHHAGMVLLSYIGACYFPGSEGITILELKY
ncbi:Elongation of very long chain fatty acids protein [Gryllus bimaculatus]|nr:Elongation of very long chain fatty acids protein [Gryllus bimaculatus]